VLNNKMEMTEENKTINFDNVSKVKLEDISLGDILCKDMLD